MTSGAYGDTKLLLSTENLWVPVLWRAEGELASRALITRAALEAEQLQNPAALAVPRVVPSDTPTDPGTAPPALDHHHVSLQPSPLNLCQAGGWWLGRVRQRSLFTALSSGEDASETG